MPFIHEDGRAPVIQTSGDDVFIPLSPPPNVNHTSGSFASLQRLRHKSPLICHPGNLQKTRGGFGSTSSLTSNARDDPTTDFDGIENKVGLRRRNHNTSLCMQYRCNPTWRPFSNVWSFRLKFHKSLTVQPKTPKQQNLTFPRLMASTRATGSMIPPLAQLMMRTPFLHLSRFALPISPRVSGVSGVCSVMKSDLANS